MEASQPFTFALSFKKVNKFGPSYLIVEWMQNVRGCFKREKLSSIQVAISPVIYWSVRASSKRGEIGVKEPATSSTFLENMIIQCKIKLIVNQLLLNISNLKKQLLTFPKPIKSSTLKENHIVIAGGEILHYKQIAIQVLLNNDYKFQRIYNNISK